MAQALLPVRIRDPSVTHFVPEERSSIVLFSGQVRVGEKERLRNDGEARECISKCPSFGGIIPWILQSNLQCNSSVSSLNWTIIRNRE